MRYIFLWAYVKFLEFSGCWFSIQPWKQRSDLLFHREVLHPPQQFHQLWHLLLCQQAFQAQPSDPIKKDVWNQGNGANHYKLNYIEHLREAIQEKSGILP